MTGEIVRHPDSGETLQFHYSSLRLCDEQLLRSLLDEPKAYLNLLPKAEPDFEIPTLSMSLYAEREATPESLQLHATSEFTPVEILDVEGVPTWQDGLKAELLELYPDAINHEMPHDSDSLYVEIGSNFYARVSTSAAVDRCIVDLDLVTKEAFNKYAGTVIEDDEQATPDDPALILKEFAILWLHAHDTMIQNSAYSPLPSELSLAIPHPEKATDSKALVTTSSETSMPASELIDNERTGFRYIGGLTYAKDRLMEIAETFGDSEAHAFYGIRPTHFMLYGPPGTGKTSLVEALADEIDAKLIRVSSKDVIEKWVGSSARNLGDIFKKAKRGGHPTVVFFDEFEALGGKSEKLSSSERHDVLKVFNTEIIDITQNHPNVIIATATNSDTQDIEPSLIRSGRLEPIRAGKPTETERVDIWAAVLTKVVLKGRTEVVPEEATASGEHRFQLYADDINPLELARRSDDMTGADFEEVLEFARRRCFRHYKQTGQHRQVCQADLIDGIIAIQRR